MGRLSNALLFTRPTPPSPGILKWCWIFNVRKTVSSIIVIPYSLLNNPYLLIHRNCEELKMILKKKIVDIEYLTSGLLTYYFEIRLIFLELMKS